MQRQTVTIELDAFHAAALEALAAKLKASPSQVVALALDQFGHEPQNYTPEQAAMIQQGLEELRQGATEEETEVIFANLGLGPLTPEDVKAIEIGKRQARSGETISHEEMKAELNELLR